MDLKLQVTGNGVIMRAFSSGKQCTSLAVAYRFGRSMHTQEKVTCSARICMTRSEEPSPVFGSRTKPTIHLAILWREILPSILALITINYIYVIVTNM